MSLSVTHNGFGVDRHPNFLVHLLLLPSLQFCPSPQSRVRTPPLFGWRCPNRTYPLRKTSRIVSRRMPSPTQFCVWPNSSCFLVKERFLFFPFPCSAFGGILYTCPPIIGTKTSSCFATEDPCCGDARHRVSYARDDDQGADNTTAARAHFHHSQREIQKFLDTSDVSSISWW